MLSILVVEDDQLCYHALSSLLKRHEITWAKDSEEAKKFLGLKKFDWALVDLDLEASRKGFELIPDLVTKNTLVSIVTGHSSENDLLFAARLGVREIIAKPYRPQELKEIIASVVSAVKGDELKSYLELAAGHFNCEALRANFFAAKPVMITGPSGTGKSRLARLIHNQYLGERAPFVHLNCAEIPETLAESILFGHVKGSFSGATQDQQGLIEKARGGTLFLDEVATLGLGLQAKLLKVVETKTIRPVGGQELEVNFNIVSATCENIQGEGFRRDLFYRLAGECIELKPLRGNRRLISEIMREAGRDYARRLLWKEEAKQALYGAELEGNVRTLLDGLRRIYALRKIEIDASDVADIFNIKKVPQTFQEKVLAFEHKLITEAFERSGKSVRKTLRELGITSSTFYRVMKVPSC